MSPTAASPQTPRRRHPPPLSSPTSPRTPFRKRISFKSIRNAFSTAQAAGDTPRMPPDSPKAADAEVWKQVPAHLPRVTKPVFLVQGSYPMHADLVIQQRTFARRGGESPRAKPLPPVPGGMPAAASDSFLACMPKAKTVRTSALAFYSMPLTCRTDQSPWKLKERDECQEAAADGLPRRQHSGLEHSAFF
jgi:hypothetical protein